MRGGINRRAIGTESHHVFFAVRNRDGTEVLVQSEGAGGELGGRGLTESHGDGGSCGAIQAVVGAAGVGNVAGAETFRACVGVIHHGRQCSV